mgnify:FL=1
MKERKDILLLAAYDLLRKCSNSRYVLDAMETTVFYDDAECDGACLLQDIKDELGLE